MTLRIVPLADLEKRAILDALRSLDGDKLEAARRLGIGKTTLYRKLQEFRLNTRSRSGRKKARR